MKVFVVLAFILVSVSGSILPLDSHPGTDGLKEDIDDFIALLPLVQMQNISIQYLANDKDVQEAFDYVMSEEFKEILLNLEAIYELKEFLKYLEDHGLNVYFYINELHKFLGMAEFVPRRRMRLSPKSSGVRAMLDEIEAILPKQQLEEMYDDKMANSPAFQNLIFEMRTEDFKELVAKLRANVHYQALIERAKFHGVDIELLREILHEIFGW